nr:MAG TPA: hypothetical protein [Caudoviricetes sp.]
MPIESERESKSMFPGDRPKHEAIYCDERLCRFRKER